MSETKITYEDALITDPDKKEVTDLVVEKEIARLGLQKSEVDFKYDYSKEFPRSKMYQVNKPGSELHRAHIVAITQLDMVNARGYQCKVGWIQNQDGSFSSDENQFNATVSGGAVSVTYINDQPNGALCDSKTEWNPVLKLGGIEVLSVAGPTLIDDPYNSNYKNNVLKYEYGICLRYLRLIEGKLFEQWSFSENPGDTIRIEHGFTGAKPKLGRFAVDADTEEVPYSAFIGAEYPFTVPATLTAYPDASAETNTFDGNIHNATQDTSWATLRGVSGTSMVDDNAYCYDSYSSSATSNQWKWISRSELLFDTSPIGSGKYLASAVFSIYGDTYYGANGSSSLVVVSSNPASNTGVSLADFDNFGTTSFGSLAHSSFNATGYNDITLNASGLAAIAVSGITKLGTRGNYDVTGDTPPNWSASTTYGVRYCSSDMGAGYKPKLVVTYYTIVAPTMATSDASSVTVSAARLNGSVSDIGYATTTRYFEYGKTTSYELGTIDKGVGGVGSYYHDLSGLDAGTMYYYRAKGVNSAGTGYGAQKSFTTLSSGWSGGKVNGVDSSNIGQVDGVPIGNIGKIDGVS